MNIRGGKGNSTSINLISCPSSNVFEYRILLTKEFQIDLFLYFYICVMLHYILYLEPSLFKYQLKIIRSPNQVTNLGTFFSEEKK